MDLDCLDEFEEFEFDYDSADEECMKAVSELLGHHRTDRALMNTYLK